MANILEEIAAYKRDFVGQSKLRRSLADLQLAAADAGPTADFGAALRGDGIAVIAEIKKAAPSKGVIREDFDPEHIAAAYAENGASALSVLTDQAYFQGHDDYLTSARRVAELPALRKDFTIDAYQIYEARVIGADAILLIVALMDGGQLEDSIGLSTELGMATLVEVHDEGELHAALASSAKLIGVNNRDLKTFETTLETTFGLLDAIPSGITTVSESGINSSDDVERLAAAGVDAILVGEAMMRAPDPGAKLRELLGA
jgi:indole-3-glycerol phosphate synthase